MRLGKDSLALSNYEVSRRLITEEKVPIDASIHAKILANIGSIYSQRNLVTDAIRLFEMSLELKQKKYPHYHSEILLSYSNLG